jgi:hypothetical protein
MNDDTHAAKAASALGWPDNFYVEGVDDWDATYFVHREEPDDTGVLIEVTVDAAGREMIQVWSDDEPTVAKSRADAVRLYDELIHRP